MLSRRLLRIKVLKALYAHLKADADSMIASEKTLLTSIDKAYDLYFMMLALPVELVRYARERQETARNKKLPTYEDLNPNTKFTDNAVIRLLGNSDSVNDYLTARKLSWHLCPEVIRALYSRLASQEYFQQYMAGAERSLREDERLLETFFEREVQDCEALDVALEEMSIYWSDDMGFILPMVVRTLSGIRASHLDVKVLPKFKSSEDLDFVKTLFEKSLINYDANQRYIEKFTSNWELDRIVFMDNLILGTAMTELIAFPSIPVKVTLDEYIEISKYYSTPGSSLFINGVLDKIADALAEEGRVVKAGRGLI